MRYLPLCATLAALAACGNATSNDPPLPEKTVFDPLLQPRDQAQELADKLPQERKENLDHAIDADAR